MSFSYYYCYDDDGGGDVFEGGEKSGCLLCGTMVAVQLALSRIKCLWLKLNALNFPTASNYFSN